MHIWTIFWGSFFILLGTSIILRAFGINLPFFRIALAILIIFIGIKILFPGPWHNAGNGRTVMFGEAQVKGNEVSGEYSAVFGSQKIDLTDVELKEKNVNVKIDAVFGGTEVMIDSSKPVKIQASAVFGGVTFPGGTAAAFGTNSYHTDSYNEEAPYIFINANAVFGGIEIKAIK